MEQNQEKKMSIWKKLGIAILILIILNAVFGDSDTNTNSSGNSNVEEHSSAHPAPVTSVGETLHTDYFDITVHSVKIDNNINTGNEFTDVKGDPNSKFLIINATFKNTDNESRMIEDGIVKINYNNQDYNFDKSEPFLVEGWGLFLDQINPLISKTTNLVYKIPAELKGDLYWNPGRSDEEDVIFLGTLN